MEPVSSNLDHRQSMMSQMKNQHHSSNRSPQHRRPADHQSQHLNQRIYHRNPSHSPVPFDSEETNQQLRSASQAENHHRNQRKNQMKYDWHFNLPRPFMIHSQVDRNDGESESETRPIHERQSHYYYPS